jgi:hypothetical protein
MHVRPGRRLAMPEVLTKQPEVVLKVVTSGGGQCNTGTLPRILTKCPREKFCALPGGEMCIYGANELDSMTQLTRAEVCGRTSPQTFEIGMGSTGTAGVALALAYLGGVASARLFKRVRP